MKATRAGYARLRRRMMPLVVILAAAACGSSPKTAVAARTMPTSICPLGEVSQSDGSRRLALIVGVGEYANPAVPDLIGPPHDAERMYKLLTTPVRAGGFGYALSNVCYLTDEKATTAAFRDAFQKHLVDNARGNQDTALIFYAGHGSQAPDRNGDEPDNNDETFMFHDARTGDVSDMLDDEFHDLLRTLHAKTQNIVTILDSCNSGTATRGDSPLVARFFEPAEVDEDSPHSGGSGDGDGGGGWAPEALPGLIALTAASDGTAAMEINGGGIFTDALIDVLSRGSTEPLTYAQLARQVPPLMTARSYQIPYFQGNLDKFVFDATDRTRPVAWDITDIGDPIKLSGTPLPGMGPGAVMRVYAGNADARDVNDPARAKATLQITASTGVNADGQITARGSGADAVEIGDLAVLMMPAPESVQLTFTLRAAGEAGGVAADKAKKIRDLLASNTVYSASVKLLPSGGDFELSTDPSGAFLLRGPENTIRNRLQTPENVLQAVWRHSRQKALLQLRGEGGYDFVDNKTLKVRAVPQSAERQDVCANGEWKQAADNEHQIIPLCYKWNVEVELSQSSPEPLSIGAVLLSSDGTMIGLPHGGAAIVLKPGEKHMFRSRQENFRAVPPLGVVDHLLVFGTRETNAVAWHQLSTPITPRAGQSRLQATLQSFVVGTRGQAVDDEVATETWTMSRMPMEVEANEGFGAASRTGQVQTREYTLDNFDLRPYLPADPESSLYKVLTLADHLTRASRNGDGYRYKQHPWDRGSDETNLKEGIDCSRAQWYAFTRAGLPYNNDDKYLYTASMVGASSRMKDQFDACPLDAEPRLGDLLVYRSDDRGDGHVVMVIDPLKRVGWGSHGWDGNAKASDHKIPPDTGVEYQRIKYKRDWLRWDRGDMQLKACWRYRRFAEERQSGRGAPAIVTSGNVCDPRQCRASP